MEGRGVGCQAGYSFVKGRVNVTDTVVTAGMSERNVRFVFLMLEIWGKVSSRRERSQCCCNSDYDCVFLMCIYYMCRI